MPTPPHQDEHPVRRDRRPAGEPASDVELRLVLTADWVAPSLVRERLEGWLRGHQWPPAQAEELVLAASEAVSNSVEHGYLLTSADDEGTGTVRLAARLVVADDGYRSVELEVADDGRWQEPDGAASSRGHGLLIMRSCTDALTVDGSPGGTTVRLRSRPAPPLR